MRECIYPFKCARNAFVVRVRACALCLRALRASCGCNAFSVSAPSYASVLFVCALRVDVARYVASACGMRVHYVFRERIQLRVCVLSARYV